MATAQDALSEPRTSIVRQAEAKAATFSDSPRARFFVALVYLIFASTIVVSTVIGPGRAMSRIDEPTHADLAYQMSHFRVPAAGDTIAQDIRMFWACVGQERYVLPECGEPAPAYQFPYAGLQYNYYHPPGYYFSTGIVARGLAELVPQLHFVDAARLTGALWLTAGMFTMFVALRRWKLDPAIALVAPVLMAAFPRVLHASTTVNPDAAAMLAGSLALWLAAKIFVDGYRGWMLPAALAGAVGLVKTISTVPFIVLGLLIVIRNLRDLRGRGFNIRDYFIPMAMAAAIIVPYLLWQAFQAGQGSPTYENPLVGINTKDVTGFPIAEWSQTLFLGFNLASDYYLQPPLNIALMVTWTRFLNVLIIGAIGAVIVAFVKDPIRRSLGWMMVAGSLLYPLIVQIQAYFSTATPIYFPNPTGRYGLALIPIAVTCIVLAAVQAGYRRAVYVLTALGIIVLVTTIINGYSMVSA